MALSEENAAAFLKELAELSKKHKIAIAGCGCCGSPWLYYEEGESFDTMEYTAKTVQYEAGLLSKEYIEFDYPQFTEGDG